MDPFFTELNNAGRWRFCHIDTVFSCCEDCWRTEPQYRSFIQSHTRSCPGFFRAKGVNSGPRPCSRALSNVRDIERRNRPKLAFLQALHDNDPDLLDDNPRKLCLFDDRVTEWHWIQTYGRVPLPESLSRRIPLDIWYNVLQGIDSETDQVSTMLACRDWYQCFVHSDHCPALCIQDRKSLLHARTQYKQDGNIKQRLNLTTTLRIHPRDGDSKAFCDIVPVVLADCLPALRTLVLHGCIRPAMYPTFPRSLRSFSGLRRLKISDFILVSPGQLCRILVACPQLETLVLRNGRCTSAVPPSPTSHPAATSQTDMPQLQKLELCQLNRHLLAALVPWFTVVHPSFCTHVTDLSISSDISGKVAQLLTQLLRAIGRRLKRLTLVRTRARAHDDTPKQATISLTKNLSLLHVELRAEYNSERANTDLARAWRQTLETIPSVVQERIGVALTRTGRDDASRSDSESTQNAPSCGHSSSDIRCHYVPRGNVARYVEHLATQHPSLFRGIPRLCLSRTRKAGRTGLTRTAQCKAFAPEGHAISATCNRTLFAATENIARHLETAHTVRCRWVEQGKRCKAEISPLPLAVAVHILTHHSSLGRGEVFPEEQILLAQTASRLLGTEDEVMEGEEGEGVNTGRVRTVRVLLREMDLQQSWMNMQSIRASLAAHPDYTQWYICQQI
ncbi:uncharacterized protein C8Q71DRAFT_184472 [Rhodofomes roseus]|uniref:F-box domain-containing protein n=1 Tax=Rhodofomes roseus TaxID=34475 RepID=A0ABQ8K8B4_9APHY|nr:uncharacterized protein C8Q71DRAFT_184472 [Rhodofomes roseus]KAH9833464.1 hypothetical protein C8Q71DRAFT_184472 [Rhodofomes roseus]